MALDQFGFRVLANVDEAPDMLRRLHRFWEDERNGRALPPPTAIDPLKIRFALGDVILVSVVRTPEPRFRFRLVGSEFVRRFGFDLTGGWVEDFPEPQQREAFLAAFRHVVEARTPLFVSFDMMIDRRSLTYAGAVHPFSGESGEVDLLMIGVEYCD